MKDTTQERVFQDDIISQMVANGWVQGTGEGYNRESALYEVDVLTFIKQTQPKEWEKFCKVFPTDSERHFLDALVTQLKKPMRTPLIEHHVPLALWACCVMV